MRGFFVRSQVTYAHIKELFILSPSTLILPASLVKLIIQENEDFQC
jgi:hypothetical protein